MSGRPPRLLNAIEKGRIDTVVLASAWTSLADTNLYPVQPGGEINPGNKIEPDRVQVSSMRSSISIHRPIRSLSSPIFQAPES